MPVFSVHPTMFFCHFYKGRKLLWLLFAFLGRIALSKVGIFSHEIHRSSQVVIKLFPLRGYAIEKRDKTENGRVAPP